jgi:predicted DNA helicase
VDEALHPSLLSSRVAAHPRMKVARDLIRQAENLRNRSGDSRKGAFAARAERAQRRNEWRAMIKDARLYAQQAEEEVLRNARVVACTLTVLGGPQLAGEVFDLCILDEASQAVTPLALIPLPVVERVVLVGDHKQLPPTVVSEKAARGGLSTTLFDRLHASGAPSAMLTVQHRMHQDLMAFPNMRHYGGQLTAHSTVATRSLANALGHPVTDAELQAPFTFIDTAGTGFSEEQPEGSLSQRNPGEARLCAALVRQVMAQGVPASDVGLVVPYRAQVSLLTEMMAAEIKAGLEVDSVDSFQGREKEVVVLGLTRSNENGEMGFVNDARRLNVALTRARTLLRVVGDAATVGVSGEGRALLDHAARTGSHVSAWGLSIFEAPNT